MPVTFPAMKRRDFLLGTIAAGFFAAFSPKSIFAEEANQNHWIFLSDTHVTADPNEVRHGSNPNKNFTEVRDAVLSRSNKPAGVIVTGDFAALNGQLADYQRLKSHIVPYSQSGVPVHVSLGNHDHLEHYYEVFTDTKKDDSPVADKHVLVLETPHCNLFLLDALYWIGAFPGQNPDLYKNSNDFGAGFFGGQQLRWLKKELIARKNKPAILFAHHNLDHSPGALMDREQFWSIIKSQKHVKAYIYGHTHVYRQTVLDDIHLINLPALGWEFSDGKQPLGWTDALFSPEGIKLTLHTINQEHPQNNDVREFAWLR